MTRREPTVHVKRTCPLCGKESSVEMPYEAWLQWHSGLSAQKAWPDGTPGQREVLVSGSHESCFDKAFEEE